MMRIVILDRDGVINEEQGEYIKHVHAFEPIAGSIEAIVKLSQHGYQVVVATNQAGVGKGLMDAMSLSAIHQHLFQSVRTQGGYISAVVYCPHHPEEGCSCRKPAPGMLLQIQQRFGLEHLHQAVFVGDSARDLIAAQRANCPAHLVLTGHGQKTLDQERPAWLLDNHIHANLASFVEHYLSAPC